MNCFKSLGKEIYDGLEGEQEYWDGNVDVLYDLIQQIKNPIGGENCKDLYNSYVNYAGTCPVDGALSLSELKASVYGLADEIPHLDE